MTTTPTQGGRAPLGRIPGLLRTTAAAELASAWLASIARVAAWIAVSAIAFRQAGPEAFAIVALVRSTLGILNYAAVSLAPAVLHALGKAGAQAPPASSPLESSTAIYSTAAAVALAAAGVGAALCIALSGILARWLHVPPAYESAVRGLVVWMGLGTLLRLLGDIPGAISQFEKRLVADNLALALGEALWTAAAIALIASQGPGVLPAALVLAIGQAFAAAALATTLARFAIAHFRARARLRLRGFNLGVAGLLLGLGLWMTLAQAADFLYAPTDNLIINRLLGARVVADYAPAVQIDGALLLPASAIGAIILARASRSMAKCDYRALRRECIAGTLASAALLAFLALGVLASSSRIFSLWLHDTMPATRAVLPLVMVHTVIGGASAPCRAVLLALGRVRAYAAAALVAAAGNAVMSYVLVAVFNLGLKGIIYGTLVAVIARCAFWMPWYVRRALAQEEAHAARVQGAPA